MEHDGYYQRIHLDLAIDSLIGIAKKLYIDSQIRVAECSSESKYAQTVIQMD